MELLDRIKDVDVDKGPKRSATIWVCGRTRDPYSEILGVVQLFGCVAVLETHTLRY